MSSILGHSLAGISLASAAINGVETRKRSLLVIAALLSILPDIDVLVYIAFGYLGITPHRGVTHTLLFALFIGITFSAILHTYLTISFKKTFLLIFGIMTSHLILDYFMGCGPEVPFFWPFIDHGYLFPYKILPTAYYSLSIVGLTSLLFHLPTIICLIFEVVIFLPVFMLFNRKSTLPKAVFIATSIMGLIGSAMLYNSIQ